MLPLGRLLAALVLGAAIGLFGVFLVVMGGLEAYRAVRLSDHGMRTAARAFDCTIAHESAGDAYQLHYELEVGGITYSATDATGRSGLWREVPYDTWETARTTGAIPVRYLPEDPSINAPEAAMPDPVRDDLALVVMGGLCGSVGLFFPLLVLFARRR